MSLTTRTGPRLMPRRGRRSTAQGSATTAPRRLLAAKSASSGSPRKQRAAPSPASSTTRSATGACSSARPRSSVNRTFIAACWETGCCEYCTMSTKTMVPMRFPGPSCDGSIDRGRSRSALDHLEGLLEAPPHAVERPTEEGDLVPARFAQLRNVEVAGAHLVGGAGHAGDGLDDHPAQHHVEGDEQEGEHGGERAHEGIEGALGVPDGQGHRHRDDLGADHVVELPAEPV